jgi:sulfur carrier protein
LIDVDNTRLPWYEGMTIATVLSRLDNVGFCSVVRLNGRLISSPDFEKTIVPDEAKIDILPIVAGG